MKSIMSDRLRGALFNLLDANSQLAQHLKNCPAGALNGSWFPSWKYHLDDFANRVEAAHFRLMGVADHLAELPPDGNTYAADSILSLTGLSQETMERMAAEIRFHRMRLCYRVGWNGEIIANRGDEP